MRALGIALGLFGMAVAVGIGHAQFSGSAVVQSNIQKTICRRGYTQTVRPPVRVTRRIKQEMMIKLGLYDTPRNYELDHIVPLEVGGAPDDPRNFQIQPWRGPCNAHQKDDVENVINRKVCSGELTLAQGQAEFSPVDHWKEAYKQYVNNNGCDSALGQ